MSFRRRPVLNLLAGCLGIAIMIVGIGISSPSVIIIGFLIFAMQLARFLKNELKFLKPVRPPAVETSKPRYRPAPGLGKSHCAFCKTVTPAAYRSLCGECDAQTFFCSDCGMCKDCGTNTPSSAFKRPSELFGNIDNIP